MPTGIFVRTPEILAKLVENGRANKGRKHTQEAKSAISESLRGNKRRLGVPHTQELKERFSMKRRPLQERFWEKVDKTGDCWLWIGRCWTNGYGRFLLGSKVDRSRREVLTHRLSYEWANGPIPDNLLVCHSCDANYPRSDITYRRCVRPDHLFLGTPADNSIDMANKGRAKGKSKNFRTEYRGRSIMTPDTVRAMRQEYATGNWTVAEVASHFGIGKSGTEHVLYRQSWRDID